MKDNMDERALIVARLRAVADQIEAGTSQEEAVKKELLERIKKEVVETIRKSPEFKGKDPEEVWRRIEPAIRVDVKKVFCSA
jgi:hypothetical protein